MSESFPVDRHPVCPEEQSYVVAGRGPWCQTAYRDAICKLPGQWHYIGSPEGLSPKTIEALKPRYIFFLHWSWKIPEEIVEKYECVCFHMTEVPYGRGGSPLQNLILRGHTHTKLTALRMNGDWDAGPVYLQENLCLAGAAEEIYLRAAFLASRMIQRIIQKRPAPVPQTGEIVPFRRRKPEESEVPEVGSLRGLYDFIRMLDAEGYPRAFFAHKGFRYEFRRAVLYNGRVVADAIITPITAEEENP